REPVAKPGQPNSMTDERSLNDPKWSSDKATIGEEVTLSVNIQSQQGLRGGVQFKIYADGADPKIDPPVATKSVRKDKGLAEVKWRYQYIPGDTPLSEKPKFFFEAWAFRCEKVKSGTIEMGDKLKINIIDILLGKEVDMDYELYFSDGQKSGSGNIAKSSTELEEADLVTGIYTIHIKSKNEKQEILGIDTSIKMSKSEVKE
ncbi:MAG: hypothetical protein JXR70_01590, partial [Spirochaetales bacterium]|nr:hypothetical protein [Spirochaetales bacterium]